MVQATDRVPPAARGATADAATDAAPEQLVAALYAVLNGTRQLSRGRDELDRASLGVLHQISSEGPVRLCDVACGVGLDASTVSRHVRALADADLVTRTEDPEDGRAALLSVTRGGKAVLRRTFERRRATLGAALCGWSAADRESLTDLMTRLATDLADQPGGKNR
jgi:DNA-binding MarR family transcriptional regulator